MIVELDITSPDTLDSLRRELAATKAELRARDLECVRLRDGLRRALYGWEHLWRSENNDAPPAEIAELWKLVQ